jgi:DNA repair photolyase
MNLPGLLEEELSKRRVLPRWVILNTSSDCFQPHPDILRITFEVITILLDHQIGISILTKGLIPQKFLDLFKKNPGRILAQVGIVSLSKRYWAEYEPRTPAPEERLGNIQGLQEIGITPEVRIDPIVPFLTDSPGEMEPFLRRLRDLEVKRVTLSYLHLRPAIQRQLLKELSPLDQRLIESCFRGQNWRGVGSSTKTKLLPGAFREKGYLRIQKMAEAFGITASICRCKNPEFKGDPCVSYGEGMARRKSERSATSALPMLGIFLYYPESLMPLISWSPAAQPHSTAPPSLGEGSPAGRHG